jgi:protein-tyrosine phosphatase
VADYSILFVCLGNICRSPLAEAVCRKQARERDIEKRLLIESRGTGGWHVGEKAHNLTRSTARRFGVNMESHRAQQVSHQDLVDFDLVVAMDSSNYRELERMGAAEQSELIYLRAYDDEAGSDIDVPDPFYGAEDGFLIVQRIVERSCDNLLDALSEKLP